MKLCLTVHRPTQTMTLSSADLRDKLCLQSYRRELHGEAAWAPAAFPGVVGVVTVATPEHSNWAKS